MLAKRAQKRCAYDGLFLDVLELDLEDERCEGRNATRSAFAIGQGVGDDEFVFRTHGHEFETFLPSLITWLRGKLGGFTALVAAVEDGAVDELTFVVYFYSRGVGREGTVALAHSLVEQTRGKSDKRLSASCSFRDRRGWPCDAR